MRNLKVAIIGAGITGLYLGLKLSDRGYQVTIFEKKKEIGKKSCSGLFSERILNFLPESKELIQNKLNSVLIYWPRKKIKVNFSQPVLVINHFELDNLVAKLVESRGVEIILNREIKKEDFPFLKENFQRVIGSDGANSILRKILNLPEPNFRLGIKGSILKRNFSNFAEIFPTKFGFIWKIPRGNETEYGIIERIDRAKEFFDRFLNKNSIFLEKVESDLIAQGLILPKNNSFTLCGEASGLTKPWSGGGVIWGLTAADILLKNFPDFLKYKIETERFFKSKIIFSNLVKSLVYFFGFNFPLIFPKKIKIDSDFLL